MKRLQPTSRHVFFTYVRIYVFILLSTGGGVSHRKALGLGRFCIVILVSFFVQVMCLCSFTVIYVLFSSRSALCCCKGCLAGFLPNRFRLLDTAVASSRLLAVNFSNIEVLCDMFLCSSVLVDVQLKYDASYVR